MFWLTRDTKKMGGTVFLFEVTTRALSFFLRQYSHLPTPNYPATARWLRKPPGLPPIKYGECKQVWITDKEPGKRGKP